MWASRIESFINTSTSALQCGHLTRSARLGATAISRSQAAHLKCIMRDMRVFLVILLVALSVHAQSLADAARKERERRAHLKPATVLQAEEASQNLAAVRLDLDQTRKTLDTLQLQGPPKK